MADALKEVNIGSIESELREIWKQLAENSQKGGEQAVLRTRVLNIAVYAPGDPTGNEITQTMAEVSRQHPGRIIVMLPQDHARPAALHAWVTAFCHKLSGGRQQVCCEQIMLRAEGESISALPSLVRPLFVPDLPVALWWRALLDVDNEDFLELVDTSDRVIVDSALLSSPEEDLPQLAALLRKEQQWTAFSDLNWARMTPWRTAIAGFYDIPDYRSYLNRMNRVEVEYKSNPVQAFLIVSWLASRLKWSPASRTDLHGKEVALKFSSGPREIRINIRAGNNTSVKCIAESSPSAEFMVTTTADGKYLQSSAAGESISSPQNVTAWTEWTDAQLITRELEILGHDGVYEQALGLWA